MTQEEFDRLPLMLRPGDVKAALGIDREQVVAWRVANPDVATKLPGMRQYRYYKVKVAEVLRVGCRVK